MIINEEIITSFRSIILAVYFNNFLLWKRKTKKLQLRKETIAVLNGERMVHVVGGGARLCHADIDCPGDEVCLNDPNGNYICVPMDGESGIRLTIKKSCKQSNCNDCWSEAGHACQSIPITNCQL